MKTGPPLEPSPMVLRTDMTGWDVLWMFWRAPRSLCGPGSVSFSTPQRMQYGLEQKHEQIDKAKRATQLLDKLREMPLNGFVDILFSPFLLYTSPKVIHIHIGTFYARF